MFTWAMLLGGTFVASALLTRLMRGLAQRYGAVDGPDGHRKLQASPVPVWGGAAVFLAFTLFVALAWPALVVAPEGLGRLLPALLASATGVVLLGLFDDALDLDARKKLLVQIAVVTPLLIAGFTADKITLMNHSLSIGWLGAPLALFWLIGCINAMNLLDGMDGNASLIGLVAVAAVGVIAARHGHGEVVLVAAILAGGILGFLVFNLPLPTATIYLGDSGSTLIGLVLGVLCFEAARVAGGELRIAVPLVTMTIPILDSTLAVVRRKLTGRSFDCADRGHIHHRLLQRGLNSWHALAIIGVLCVVSGGAAIAATTLESEPLAWLASLVLIVTLVQSGFFGHYELSLVRRRSSGWLSGGLLALGRLRNGPLHISPAPVSFDEAWDELTRELPRWRASRLELNIHDGTGLRPIHVWHDQQAAENRGHHWRLAMSFGSRGMGSCELVVTGRDRRTSQPWYLDHLAKLLQVYGRAWTTKSTAVVTAAADVSTRTLTAPALDGYRDAA